VFPARYELNSYIVFRKRLVSKRLKKGRATKPEKDRGKVLSTVSKADKPRN
jgi:hypothetical protein